MSAVIAAAAATPAEAADVMHRVRPHHHHSRTGFDPVAATVVPPGYAYGGYGNGPGPGWDRNGYGPGYGPGYAPGYGYIPAGGPNIGFDLGY